MKEKIEIFVQQNMEQMIDDIRTLVSIRSVKGEPEPNMPFGKGPAEAVACMERIACKHGFKTKNFGNYMLTINMNDKPDELGILCHLDVVHEGSGWTTPPYEATIRDGKIYGRGTADNKGPAIASLYAMKCVRELGIPLSKNARLMLGTDEESGSNDLKEYFKLQSPPNYCFSPDAAFPVYNIEKGQYKPVISSSFCEDPTLPRIISIEGGHAVNIVPDKATAVIQGIERKTLHKYIERYSKKTDVIFTAKENDDSFIVVAEGVSTHASYPEDGNNALTAIIELLANIPFSKSKGFSSLQAVNELLPHGDCLGQSAKIKMSDDLSGPLTCNLGIFKYNLTSLEGSIDIRTPICSNEDNTTKVFEDVVSKLGLSLSATDMLLPHHVPEELPFIQTLLHAYEDYTGMKGECVSMGGGTYVHGIPNSVAFGASYPDTETYAHAADEYSVIKELASCVKIFSQVIVDMCK
jgi:succinyl-diaminopimelate desuccinylase